MTASSTASLPRTLVLLNERRAAATLGVEPRTMQEWRCKGGGPPFIRVSSRCVRYRLSDLEQWVAERRATSTADNR
jgi:hypothetical protein